MTDFDVGLFQVVGSLVALGAVALARPVERWFYRRQLARDLDRILNGQPPENP